MKKQHEILLDLLDSSGRALYGLLFRVTLREHIAEELMQELFIKLNDNKKLAKIENPAAYARKTAINLAFDWRRKNREGANIESVGEPQAVGMSPLDKLIGDEELNCVLDSIEKLPAEFRQVLVMRSIEQASYDQIAAETGKSVHHVRSILHRARTKLKELVKSHMVENSGKEAL